MGEWLEYGLRQLTDQIDRSVGAYCCSNRYSNNHNNRNIIINNNVVETATIKVIDKSAKGMPINLQCQNFLTLLT